MNQGHWQSASAPSAPAYNTAEAPMEYNQNMDVELGDDSMKKRKPWERLGPDGRPIKRKPNPARRNMMLRKSLQPKNSVMCLNELQTGLKYVTEKVETVGNFMCTVEVNNQTFCGYGSSKDQAKQAAAESALMSFVKPPPPKPAAGQHPNPEDDTTPWKAIASFAMYKLFTDWRDNKIGGASTGNFESQKNVHDLVTGFPAGAGPMSPQVKADAGQNITAHLNRVTPVSGAPVGGVLQPQVSGATIQDRLSNPSTSESTEPVKNTLKPISQSKLNPEKLATSQPVMVLHQMCPQIVYNSVEKVENNQKVFQVSADINGQIFTGEGTAVKRAKIQLAKTVLKALYDIDNVYAAN